MHTITSTQNEKYKFFKSLKQKKYRTKTGLYTVEGMKSVLDAASSGAQTEALIVSESFFKSQKSSIPRQTEIYSVSDSIFAPLSDTEAPQGIIAVIKKDCEKEFLPDLSKAYIYCDRLQDPGNLGTIIRTADAAGFGGILLSNDCADLYSPKTVRSSMGSFFHIQAYENCSLCTLSKLKTLGFSVVCGILSDKTIDYTAADFTKPVLLVIGNEANGICDEILKISDCDVKIPISGKAESLNAAVAAGILMYEVNRQRNAFKKVK